MFLAALLFVFAVVPAGKVKAAEVSRTYQNEKEEIVFNDSKINQLGAGTYEGYVTNLKQTNATSNSVTVSWNAVSGATGYLIYSTKVIGTTVYPDQKLADTKNNSHTLYLPEETVSYGIGIFPYDANGNIGYGMRISVSTVPKQVTGLKINGAFGNKLINKYGNEIPGTKGKLSVYWKDMYCYGFEANCYNRKGRLVQKVDETEKVGTTFSKTNMQNIYSVKVRPYVYINNGNEKLYGPMSKTLYAVPQPKITTKGKDIKLHSVKLKWKKVNGATKYVVYASSKKNKGYKKVATVKKSKSSYTVKKFKGKTIDTRSKKYFKIVTYAKFGKKTVKSQSYSQLSAITKIYYR